MDKKNNKEVNNEEGVVKLKKPIAPSKLLKMAKEERANERRKARNLAKRRKLRAEAKAKELERTAEIIGQRLEKEAEYAEKHKNRTPLVISNVPRAKVRRLIVEGPSYDVFVKDSENESRNDAHQFLISSGNFNFLTQHTKQKLVELLNFFSDTDNFCLYLLYVDTLEVRSKKESLINFEKPKFKVLILERKFVRKHNICSTIDNYI